MHPVLGSVSPTSRCCWYFTYGALGLIDVTRDMWINERLTLTQVELASIGAWLSLP